MDNVQSSMYLKTQGKLHNTKQMPRFYFNLPNANVLNGGGNFSLGNTKR